MTAPLRLFALFCAVAVSLAGCKKPEPPAAPAAPEVGVVEVKTETLPLRRELVGRLAPYRSADVRARVPGVLVKRVYEEGTEVKEGQTLFQIDPAPLRASLAAAEAQLASAQASYTNARASANRARDLAPQAFVSKADLDNAEATERSAAAAVQQAQAAVASARINLGYTNVTSPIRGRAGQQQVTEGALVGQGEATLLTTVDQTDPLYVNFAMTVDELTDLRNAQAQGGISLAGDGKSTVQVQLGNGEVYGHEGLLDFSDTAVDPATGSVSLRAQLPNPDRVLLPGAFVTFQVNLGQRNNAFSLPQQAVQRDTRGAYVFVVDAQGQVVRKDVRLDGRLGGNWLVTGGISAGDKVVVSGIQKIKEGGTATTTPWQPAAAGNAPPAAVPASAPQEK
jgi:membrane fusion protein (multidrug efflux system)